jgi:peptidoglycan/xylan/chitin deacetylase (PgdA/CDA1 family)
MKRKGREHPLSFSRSLAVALSVCAVALSTSFAFALAAQSVTAPSASTPTVPGKLTPSRTAPGKPPLLYRPIGCQVKGPTQAYLHGPNRKVVAIGFDDGPAADTPAFVTMLERDRTPATFFMIGEQVTGVFGSMLRRELRAGDALGDHTFTHADLTRSRNVYGQLENTIKAIRAQTGYTPCVFRPPYGAYDSSVLRTAKSLGLATVQWNVDPTDWARPGAAAIEQRVLAQIRPGSIIISHDGGGPRGQTLAAYPHIIAALRARGYRFETIPQLLGFRTVYRRCLKLCDGLGIAGPVPRGSVVERG